MNFSEIEMPDGSWLVIHKIGDNQFRADHGDREGVQAGTAEDMIRYLSHVAHGLAYRVIKAQK